MKNSNLPIFAYFHCSYMESHQFSRTKRNNCILPLQQDRHNKNWQQKLSIGISTTSTIANKNWKTHFLHGMNQFIDFSFLTSHLVPFPGLNRKIQKYLHPIISKVFTWLGRIAWNAFLDYRDASKRHTCIYSQRMYDNIYIYTQVGRPGQLNVENSNQQSNSNGVNAPLHPPLITF